LPVFARALNRREWGADIGSDYKLAIHVLNWILNRRGPSDISRNTSRNTSPGIFPDVSGEL
jgi:hypothetical protein